MEAETSGAGAGGRAVLVVEDEPGVRLFIQTVLTRHGYAALGAGSAAEALRVAGEHRTGIDMVISDIQLPDMHGRKLVGLLREGAPELPALFISGCPGSDETGPGARRDRFVAKPFRAQDLLLELRRVLPAARS